MTFRNGPASLLRSQDSVLVLIDHPPYLWEQQLLNTPVPSNAS